MKYLIRTEIKRNLKSLILWGLIVIGLSVLMLSMYPIFKDSFGDMAQLLDIYPQGFLDVFGLGENGLDMTSPYGWFGVEGYLFLVLLGGAYAAILGSTILSKEEDDKTIEFLLSKPLSRNQILLGKASVILINLLLFNLALFIVLSISFVIIGKYVFLTTLLIVTGTILIQLIFASIAMAFSVFIVKSRMVMSVSLGISIGLYFFDIIIKLVDELKFLYYISPYEFVNAIDIVKYNLIEPIYLLIAFTIIFISWFITWYFYNKKDITI